MILVVNFEEVEVDGWVHVQPTEKPPHALQSARNSFGGLFKSPQDLM
jgi:hypothetical protein